MYDLFNDEVRNNRYNWSIKDGSRYLNDITVQKKLIYCIPDIFLIEDDENSYLRNSFYCQEMEAGERVI